MKNPIIENTLIELLDKEKITTEDILSVKELNLNNKELLDISDLAEFVNLEKLEIRDNCLSDLSPLANLTSLRELYASNNPFMSDEEKRIRKGKNHFTDFNFLKKLTSITHIDFTDTDLDNIDFVRMLPNVEQLWAYCNPISDISPMGACKKLQKAYFYNCPITDISVCRELPQLLGIAINCTGVSDLTPLSDCVDLDYLDAHDAEIHDITPTGRMTKMIYLTLEGNHLTDITPLLGMTSIKVLTLGNNPGLTFDAIFPVVIQLKSLIELNVAGSEFTSEQKTAFETAMPWCKMKYAW